MVGEKVDTPARGGVGAFETPDNRKIDRSSKVTLPNLPIGEHVASFSASSPSQEGPPTDTDRYYKDSQSQWKGGAADFSDADKLAFARALFSLEDSNAETPDSNAATDANIVLSTRPESEAESSSSAAGSSSGAGPVNNTVENAESSAETEEQEEARLAKEDLEAMRLIQVSEWQEYERGLAKERKKEDEAKKRAKKVTDLKSMQDLFDTSKNKDGKETQSQEMVRDLIALDFFKDTPGMPGTGNFELHMFLRLAKKILFEKHNPRPLYPRPRPRRGKADESLNDFVHPETLGIWASEAVLYLTINTEALVRNKL